MVVQVGVAAVLVGLSQQMQRVLENGDVLEQVCTPENE